MIRALVVADSDAVVSSVTAILCRIAQVDVVAYASGRENVEHVARAVRPDVALVDEMCWPGLALARVAEIRRASPLTAVVGLVDRPDAPWIVDGLRAGAAAVVPRELSSETLALILAEVIAEQGPAIDATRRSAA
jgi:DNA-binding NarL/FixJ family response regulator